MSDARLGAEQRIGKGAKRRTVQEDGTFAGGRKGRGDKLREAEERIRTLEKALGMTAKMDLSQWENLGSQRVRDEFAARAYFQSWGSGENALTLLGFTKADAQSSDLQRRIFETPGVLEIIDGVFRPAKEQREEIVQRLVRTARFGDDDASVRAAAQLARIEQWIKPDQGPQMNVNLNVLSGNQQQGVLVERRVEALEPASDDPLALLSHEPGEAIRIATGDSMVDKTVQESDA